MSKIEIPLSKNKILLGIGGSFLFVVLGIYLLTTIADQQSRFDPIVIKVIGIISIIEIKVVGIISILFFSATGIYGLRKMFDNTIGLTIDENGIVDNTNASSVGLIKWSDITEIRTERVASAKFLLIYTTNADKYMEDVKGLKRKLLEVNNKMYGTPFSITANTLKFNFNDLERMLKDRLNDQN